MNILASMYSFFTCEKGIFHVNYLKHLKKNVGYSKQNGILPVVQHSKYNMIFQSNQTKHFTNTHKPADYVIIVC